MAKSAMEKAIEKQTKAAEKAAREAKIRERATAIVNSQQVISGFLVMDKDSETTLQSILAAYDGNLDNRVNYDSATLPKYLQDAAGLQYEKLQMFGMISAYNQYLSGCFITITETSKSYFSDKELAYERFENEKKVSQSKVNRTHKQYYLFISHASKDKAEYVDLLTMTVKRLGINVFYDTDEISWGDNWKQVILDGTASSEFAIIVISNNFFDREWTERELHEFLAQQNESGQKIVLPLLYNITLEDLRLHYPELGDIQCISSERFTKEEIAILLAKELIKRYK